MYLTQFKWLLYSLYLTNKTGFKLRKIKDSMVIKKMRLGYAQKLLSALKIDVKVKNQAKLPHSGQFLLLCNHRSIIDPLVVELALQDTNIFGLWIAKKELYNSSFFGVFVRNAGAILLDRQQKQMGGFFTNIKNEVKAGNSIFIFPEGTRNKTTAPLIDFKEGSRIIALKNRLPILPVYIETNTADVLQSAITQHEHQQEVSIVIGDLIEYRSKEDIEGLYKNMFDLD